MAPMRCSDTPFSKTLTSTNCWPKKSSRRSCPRRPTLKWCADHQSRSSDCESWKNQCPMLSAPTVWTRISLEILAPTSTKLPKSSCACTEKTTLNCVSANLIEWLRTRRKNRNLCLVDAAKTAAVAQQISVTALGAQTSLAVSRIRCAVEAVPLTNEQKSRKLRLMDSLTIIEPYNQSIQTLEN